MINFISSNGCSYYSSINERIGHSIDFDTKTKTCLIALLCFTAVIIMSLEYRLKSRVVILSKNNESNGECITLLGLQQINENISKPGVYLKQYGDPRAANLTKKQKPTLLVLPPSQIDSRVRFSKKPADSCVANLTKEKKPEPLVSSLLQREDGVRFRNNHHYQHQADLTKNQKQELKPEVASNLSQIVFLLEKTNIVIEQGEISHKDVDIIIVSAQSKKEQLGGDYEKTIKTFSSLRLSVGSACLIPSESENGSVVWAGIPDLNDKNCFKEVGIELCGTKSCVASAVWNALLLAKENNAKTIAMPALYIGPSVFPDSENVVANVLLMTIYNFTKKHSDSGIQMIRIVLQNTEHFAIYQKAVCSESSSDKVAKEKLNSSI